MTAAYRMAPVADNEPAVSVVVRTTTTLTVNKDHRAITHWCGQFVSGDTATVDEAHRQHLLHCKGLGGEHGERL